VQGALLQSCPFLSKSARPCGEVRRFCSHKNKRLNCTCWVRDVDSYFIACASITTWCAQHKARIHPTANRGIALPDTILDHNIAALMLMQLLSGSLCVLRLSPRVLHLTAGQHGYQRREYMKVLHLCHILQQVRLLSAATKAGRTVYCPAPRVQTTPCPWHLRQNHRLDPNPSPSRGQTHRTSVRVAHHHVKSLTAMNPKRRLG
jgi:hypothetical protein